MTLIRRAGVAPKRDFDLAWPTWFGSDWTAPAVLPSLFDSLLTGSPEIKVEEFREDGHLVVRAELPGIDPERDVEITIVDHMLRIRAERRREEQLEMKEGFRSEFEYGSFTRMVSLPQSATEADVTANYNDGVLEVRIPTAQDSEPRRITVARA